MDSSICKFFLQGECKRGRKCRFSHDSGTSCNNVFEKNGKHALKTSTIPSTGSKRSQLFPSTKTTKEAAQLKGRSHNNENISQGKASPKIKQIDDAPYTV